MMNDTVLTKARALLQQHHMVSPRAQLLVAISGGADSVVLLYVFHLLKEELAIDRLAAVHIHHQLRGEEADRDARFVETLCKQWDIPLFLRYVDVRAVAQAQKIGLEEAGRQVRYAVFDELCVSEGFTQVATAHTASDNTETVLLHLARGTGVSGLGGIPPVRQKVIRPLLTCTRQEIEAFCKAHALPFVIDSTNSDTVYARNRVRNCIVPELYTLNPKVHEAISRLSAVVRDEEDYWDTVVTDAVHNATVDRGVYSAHAIAKLSTALQRRIIRHLILSIDGVCEERHVQKVMEILTSEGAVTVGENKAVTVKQGYLTLCNAVATDFEERVLQPGETYCFGNTVYRAEVWDRETFEKNKKIHKILLQCTCDYDKMKGTAVVRTRQTGDECSPYLRGGRRTVKKWLNAEKIPSVLRATIPIVADEEGVVLVVGLGCDERVAIDDTTEHILVFYITEEEKTYA